MTPRGPFQPLLFCDSVTHPYTARHPSLPPLSWKKGPKPFCRGDAEANPCPWPFPSPFRVPLPPSHAWRRTHGRFVPRCTDHFLLNPVPIPRSPNAQQCFHRRRPLCFQTLNSETPSPASAGHSSGYARSLCIAFYLTTRNFIYSFSI